MNTRKRRERHSINRKGNALVELVFGIPILMLLTFGSIEACNLNHLQQNAVQVSYQGALVGLTPGASKANVLSRVNDMLAAYELEGGTCVIEGMEGEDFDSLVSGDRFVVRTNIDASANLPTLAFFVSINDVQCERVAIKP